MKNRHPVKALTKHPLYMKVYIAIGRSSLLIDRVGGRARFPLVARVDRRLYTCWARTLY